jgi:two-component system NarL family response regulator
MKPENLTQPIRVLLVDDHPVIRTGLALMLQYESDMEAVAQAANGKEAVTLYREFLPDVTLMDLRMPEMDGADATAAICAEFPTARIILLSTYDGDEDVYRGLRAGAKAYLLKEAPCEELLEAIRVVHSGQTSISTGAGAKLVERMAGPELTEREREVLRLMARGYSNKEIATALFVGEGTVKFHVNHILSKMNVNDRTQAVIAALKRGLASLN